MNKESIDIALRGNEHFGAIFSSDSKYRYALWRKWDKTQPMVAVIGLNPSTANENSDDATIKRICAIAKNNGWGGIYMLNLFGIISSNPQVLVDCLDSVGPDYQIVFDEIISRCNDVLFAWGNFREKYPIVHIRERHMEERFPNAFALHINANGSPKHPLYCKKDIRVIKYNGIDKV